jgi:hypothetical protein
MNIAYHLHAISNIAVEDKVSSDGKMSNAGSNVVACLADLRIVRERLAFFVKNIEKPIGCGGIVAGDIERLPVRLNHVDRLPTVSSPAFERVRESYLVRCRARLCARKRAGQ